MRARPTQRPSITLFTSTLAALVVLGVAPAARASDADPFAAEPPPVPSAPQSNVAAPSQQAPASAPAGSAANFPTGLVERLPSSAYPEPFIRGLYGSSMWLNLQGLQWPYYPRIGVGVSGYVWIDNDFERVRIGDPLQPPHIDEFLQQGRFLLRLTPTYTNGTWFAQGQAEIVANKDQTQTQPARGVVDADDVWVRTGVWQKWDVTFGRFEAFEVYHLGMGLDLNTEERLGAYDGANRPPDLYGATFLFYRPGGPGNVALHLYPNRSLRIEVLAQWGNDGGLNEVGGRPAVIYDLGWLKLKAAAEYQLETARAPGDGTEKRNRGAAGSVQFVFAPWVEFGPNFGYAIVDIFNSNAVLDTSRSGNETSFGGFLNARLIPDMLVGVGGNYATFTNLHQNAAGRFDHSTNTQAFVAVQYLVAKQLFLKLVGAYAKSHFEASFSNAPPYDDDMLSVRLRVMYLF